MLKILAALVALAIIIGVLAGLIVFDLLTLLVFVVCIWILVIP